MMKASRKIAYWGSKGLAAAVMIIAFWSVSLIVLLTRTVEFSDPVFWAWAVPAVALQTFLYTGLFITAHDAMHGIVIPAKPRLNNLIGTLAVLLYALFSFKKLSTSHHEHHDHPGEPGMDPDFHDGAHPGFWRWYAHFVLNYVSWPQIVGMAIVFNVLEHGVGLSVANLLLFWVLPSLLSTLQLFYFGTYLPHRGQHDNPHHASSNAYSELVSFLTCYHFGYHLEHHENPWSPWWHLPTVRRAALQQEQN